MSTIHDIVDDYMAELLYGKTVTFRPTHVLTFTHACGLRGGSWEVMLTKSGAAYDFVAWREDISANWYWSAATGWLHRGHSTPWRYPGTVTVREV